MAGNPHVSGRYNIIVALITVIGGLGGIYLKYGLDNQKKEKQQIETNDAGFSEKTDSSAETMDTKVFEKKEQKNSFILVLNSDQFDSRIIIDGKPAKILSNGIAQYTEIEIGQLDKEYSIQLMNGRNDCITTKNIFKNRQKVYPCE